MKRDFSILSRSALAVLMLCLVILAAGCFGGANTPAPNPEPPAKEQPAPEVKWTHAAKALELTFVSDPFLNEHDGSAHQLGLCVYQLTDAEAFRSLTPTVTGLARLGECERFDPSVISARRVTVKPGRNEVLTFDRDEKARYVAVVGDYYGRTRTSSTRLYEIPVDTGSTGWLFWKETTYSPGKLARKIILGRTGMVGDDS